jgi:hypothetical protein
MGSRSLLTGPLARLAGREDDIRRLVMLPATVGAELCDQLVDAGSAVHVPVGVVARMDTCRLLGQQTRCLAATACPRRPDEVPAIRDLWTSFRPLRGEC